MYWILLIIAGLFEVAFTFCLGKGKKHRVPLCTYGMEAFCSVLLSVCPYL